MLTAADKLNINDSPSLPFTTPHIVFFGVKHVLGVIRHNPVFGSRILNGIRGDEMTSPCRQCTQDYERQSPAWLTILCMVSRPGSIVTRIDMYHRLGFEPFNRLHAVHWLIAEPDGQTL